MPSQFCSESVLRSAWLFGSSRVALYLASAKGTPQPRESEAHPTAAWVQVPRLAFVGAGCCVSSVTDHICSTSSLR